MRKILLISVCAMISFAVLGQTTVWNVGNDAENFPVSAGIGAGPDLSVSKNGLGIHTGAATAANMGQVEGNAKTFTSPTTNTEYTFVNRFKFNGAGYAGAANTDDTPSVMTPTQRYLTIRVAGNSSLYFIGASGSSSSPRKLFITDGENLAGTLNYPDGSLVEGVVQYTGRATTLYVYPNASINLYYISATNVVTSSVSSLSINKKVAEEQYFDMLGRHLDDNPTGLVIRKVTYADGTAEVLKEYIRTDK